MAAKLAHVLVLLQGKLDKKFDLRLHVPGRGEEDFSVIKEGMEELTQQ